MTPHISAKNGEIEKLVIMPGDPKRAKYIAEKFLENPKLVNDVRGMTAYTGTYKNKKISVVPSGMGMPSMSIYAYELFKFYGVEKIIRIGSCKSMQNNIKLNDILLALFAETSSNFSYSYMEVRNKQVGSSIYLNNLIREVSSKEGILIKEGKIYTSDVFYKTTNVENKKAYLSLGLEMESFALFLVAKSLRKQATSILTVSDTLKGDSLTFKEREKGFDKAIKLALEAIK
ncbi:MAG: purine-nucleoside phosphorylase [bacterium]|nr:purine-nucleoside phosphorylase [bacterium]